MASKYLAVGAVVPWAKAAVGAVATQASVNIAHGPSGLELLGKGMSADEMKGTQLAPQAVSPGTFEDQMRGMQRGAPIRP